LVVVPIALLLIFTLLYITNGRFLDTVRVFTGVPFAAIGGILALWVGDMSFSISAGVGFVALSGITVLGDMVLVSYVRDLLDRGMEPLRAIREGAMTRMRPVLMTGLVAALGFVPMALNTGVGAQVQRPLATVVSWRNHHVDDCDAGGNAGVVRSVWDGGARAAGQLSGGAAYGGVERGDLRNNRSTAARSNASSRVCEHRPECAAKLLVCRLPEVLGEFVFDIGDLPARPGDEGLSLAGVADELGASVVRMRLARHPPPRR
jgi:hypothetical protein